MQEDDGLAASIAAFLEIDFVQLRYAQKAFAVGPDCGVEGAACGLHGDTIHYVYYALLCDGVTMTDRNQVTWSNASRPAPAALIEIRSIDYVPDTERHGGLASQFTLWLAANLQITAIVTGALAVVFGGDVLWSLVALLFGQVIGGAVMALHAAQGPQLGLPQMISSRVQFGVYGAILPIVAVCLMYIGFSA